VIVRLGIVLAVLAAVAVATFLWRRREGRFSEASGRFDARELGLTPRAASSAVVVEFGGVHCGSCRIVESRLDKLSKEIPEMRVIRLDVEEATSLADRYEVRRVPTLFVTDPDLRIVWRASGVPSEDAIKQVLLGPEWAGRPQPAGRRLARRARRRPPVVSHDEGIACEVPQKT
jgi:thioredoxin 1